MKICILTLHRVFNYGSILQTYATQKVFEKYGFRVEIVDYITEQRTNKRLFLQVPDFVKKDLLHKSTYILFRAASICIKKLEFGRFLKKHINLSKKKYISTQDLKKDPPVADLYVAGSDQIWNSKYNEGVDEGFFLGFVSNVPKIAYASSFGKSELEEWEKKPIYKYLNDFEAISVREEGAVDIVRSLELQAISIIDPTLQVDKKDWLAIASKRLIKEKYVFLMLLYNEDNGATEYARNLADRFGWKLVKLSWELRKPKQVDILMTHRSPEDFLSLIYYSEYVVTNSFHGLAFSINLNKNFVVFPRNEFNSRIESLLRITNLSERLVNNTNEMIFSEIDYERVNKCLDNEREKAKTFLEKAIKGSK